ncbi:hypothetical protein M9H77_09764 [Catharanthus roseus]|uniref:Uncharacterized protein n=1 Tax=Catharanthus roseus TaxID=4058 RepID=A0ACC0C1H9_CATRO|nr:hypothetical protein M9H77_09764 [Catharanthus roseus]
MNRIINPEINTADSEIAGVTTMKQIYENVNSEQKQKQKTQEQFNRKAITAFSSIFTSKPFRSRLGHQQRESNELCEFGFSVRDEGPSRSVLPKKSINSQVTWAGRVEPGPSSIKGLPAQLPL